jgi:hypothetical protein
MITLHATKYDIQEFCTVLTLRYVLCTDLRTNSYFYLIKRFV